MFTTASDVVHFEMDGGVAILTIDHPPANAISRGVIAGLRVALEHISQTSEVRCVLITGQGGRFFAAGADVTEFGEAGADSISEGQQLTLEIEALSIPVIAAVNGIALGGGCEIAIACDIRIASDTARFGQPEINLGIIPGWGGTQRLPRIIGRGRALPLLYTGDPIDAATAHSYGLVSEVVAAEELPIRARALAATIAAKAPLAVAATKAALRDGLDRPLPRALEAERREFVHVFKSDDAREGVSAFLEKREPSRWTGR